MRNPTTTQPSRGVGHRRNRINRPDIREAAERLRDIMIVLGDTALADVCTRALDEDCAYSQVRVAAAINAAKRLLTPSMAKGTKP